MTEEVGKKVCEGTVADLMKDKTGKQTVITLTRKNAAYSGGYPLSISGDIRSVPS